MSTRLRLYLGELDTTVCSDTRYLVTTSWNYQIEGEWGGDKAGKLGNTNEGLMDSI